MPKEILSESTKVETDDNRANYFDPAITKKVWEATGNHFRKINEKIHRSDLNAGELLLLSIGSGCTIPLSFIICCVALPATSAVVVTPLTLCCDVTFFGKSMADKLCETKYESISSVPQFQFMS